MIASKFYDTSCLHVFENIKLEWLKITVSTGSRDFRRSYNKLNKLFMWYCPKKFETGSKPILGLMSYDTRWMYFWKISNCSGCRSQFQMSHLTSVKTFLLWLIILFLLSKLILELVYSQSLVLRPMIHVDRTLNKYQTREVANHSLK